MSVIIDLKQEVKNSRDIRLLEALVNVLTGQRCLKVEISYGGELLVHMGEPVPYAHPKLADETKGAWILSARASKWTLLLNDPPALIQSTDLDATEGEPAVGRSITPEEIEHQAEQLIGSSIVSIRIKPHPQRPPYPGVSLFVEFSDRSHLTIIPNDEPDDGSPLADWELFTPHSMSLTCGPGPVWSYVRSDVPSEVPVPQEPSQ